MNLIDVVIPSAFAQAAPAAAPAGGGFSFFIMPIILLVLMYFMMIRPQMKRAKEHKAMLDKLGNGDEVITSGGLVGTVRNISDNFITIEVADNVQVRVQRAAISNVLPKGSLKTTS